MDEEKYNLTWHSYPDHLQNVMREMMSSADFTDVTLVTHDKQSLKAHKNILSACSPIFKNILQMETPNSSHPVVYLRGIQYSELESILQFIYMGKARFYKERMNEFLMAAKDLEIKELCKNVKVGETEIDTGEHTEEYHPASNEEKYVEDYREKSDNTLGQHDSQAEYIEETVIEEDKLDSELEFNKFNQCNSNAEEGYSKKYIQSIHFKGFKYTCNQCEYESTEQNKIIIHIQCNHQGAKHNEGNTGDRNELDFAESNLRLRKKDIICIGSKFQCPKCEKLFSHINGVKRHHEADHQGLKYVCSQCEDRQFAELKLLTRHIQSKHDGPEHFCYMCEYEATSQGNLENHIESEHDGVKYAFGSIFHTQRINKYPCKQCEYKASKPDLLKSHVNSKHEGEDKFECNKCDYQCDLKQQLKLHTESKHECITYSCNQCIYKGTTKAYLKHHVQSMHEGIKYACNHCEFQSAHKHHLKSHIESKHEGIKYPCNQCDYQGSRDSLRLHKKDRCKGFFQK